MNMESHGAAIGVPQRIRKQPASFRVPPNLADYAATCAGFRWSDARAMLDGLPGKGGLNMAYEAVDRHSAHDRGDKIALRFIAKSGACTELSFGALARETNRFANALRSLDCCWPVSALRSAIPRVPAPCAGSFRAAKDAPPQRGSIACRPDGCRSSSRPLRAPTLAMRAGEGFTRIRCDVQGVGSRR